MLRCCGYWSRRRRRWVGFCLELQIRAEAATWEALLEALTLRATLRLAHLQEDPELKRSRLAPFRMRLLYAGIALMHFLRPRGSWALADLSRRLLVDGT